MNEIEWKKLIEEEKEWKRKNANLITRGWRIRDLKKGNRGIWKNFFKDEREGEDKRVFRISRE